MPGRMTPRILGAFPILGDDTRTIPTPVTIGSDAYASILR